MNQINIQTSQKDVPPPNELDDIPIEEYTGKLVPYKDSQQTSVQPPENPTIPFAADQLDDIPIEEYKGDLVKLNKTDLLKLAGREAFKNGGEVTKEVQADRKQLLQEVKTKWSKEDKKGFFTDVIKAFIEEPLKGFGKIADTLSTDIYNFVADTSKETSHDQRTASQFLPYTVKAEDVKSEIRPQGFDRTDISFAKEGKELASKVTGGVTDADYSHPMMEVFGSGMEFVAELLGPGKIANIAAKYGWNAVSKIAGFLGSVDPKVLAGGFAFGATDKVMEQNDVDGLSRLGADTAAAVGGQLLFGAAKNPVKTWEHIKDLPYKAAKFGLGITKGNYNKDIAKAFVELGLEPPVSAVTDSKIVSYANKVIGKFPLLGDHVSKRHQALESQFKTKVKDIGDRIGPVKDDAVSEAIDQAFNKMRQTAGVNNVMDISHSLGIAEGIVGQLKKAASHDDPSKATISILEDIIKKYKSGNSAVGQDVKDFLSSPLYQNMAPPQKQSALKALNVIESENVATVDAMIEQYKQLNGIMSNKALFNSDNGKGALNSLHSFRNGINKDFAKYGKTHPEFEQARNEANQLHSQVKKREEFDRFWAKFKDNVKDTNRYTSLTNALSNKQVKKELTKVLGNDMVDNLELLTKASKGMAKSAANDPNPSSTEAMREAKNIMKALMTGIVGTVGAQVEPSTFVGTISALTATTWALGSKNFVRKLVEFSERPTQSKAEILEKVLKKNTGLGLVALNKELEKLKRPQKEDKDNQESIEQIN